MVRAIIEEDRFMRAIFGCFEESTLGDITASEKLPFPLIFAAAFMPRLLSDEVKGAGNLADFGVLPSEGEMGPLEFTRTTPRMDLELPRRPKELLFEFCCSLRLPDMIPIQSSSAAVDWNKEQR